MANQFDCCLTAIQQDYVRNHYEKKSAGELSREFGCTRGVITGIWKRHRDAHGLPEPKSPRQTNAERDDEAFARYRDENQHATQIASVMGLTVSLVENILKRMRKRAGMKARGKPKGQGRKKQQRRRNLKPEDRPRPRHPHAPSYGPPVTFDDLDELMVSDTAVIMCRHYVGNPNDSLFCGRTSVPGRPYCAEHVMLAYRAPNAPPRTQETADKIKKQAKDFMEWRTRRNETELRKAA